ncbi:MAG: mismatch-specific DNA-glycosylase [candidate division Zixibacteria bacterium]|nr:mismatch-specific DNA-glycosylase [candidate division Zixibacteria bacterium]
MRIVFCGTAAGRKSEELKMYYAGRGNKFWHTLNEVGLIPKILSPSEYSELPKYGIGLTDLVKTQFGMDHQIDFTIDGSEKLQSTVTEFAPSILCFNGKRAAEQFLGRSVAYGLQPECIGSTKLFVAPSSSGAAQRSWDVRYWIEVAELSRLR